MLRDDFGRRFHYLRLSVTDQCNFRCVYCLPNGYRAEPGSENYLSVDEIRRLVAAFSGLGTSKVRVTGGEPTLRKDLPEILQAIVETPGIGKLALSTNGHDLARNADRYFRAGVRYLNVSLDSLNSRTFAFTRGSDRLADVLSGIDRALALGFDSVKINAVLMKETNAEALHEFQDYVKSRPVHVRFIELMENATTQGFFGDRHVSANVIFRQLIEQRWTPVRRDFDAGPAVEYRHADFAGSIGLIAPYSQGFCDSCNRLRVSSRGALRLCLLGSGESSLREHLQHDFQKESLQTHVAGLLKQKTKSHRLELRDWGTNRTFSAMGG